MSAIAALCACLSFVVCSAAQAQVSVYRASETVPAEFRGEWSADLADCGGAGDTRLTIEESRVRLAVSEGPVIGVIPRGASGVTLLVQMSGEGKSWNSAMNLELSPDRASLTDVNNQVTRHRCPAK